MTSLGEGLIAQFKKLKMVQQWSVGLSAGCLLNEIGISLLEVSQQIDNVSTQAVFLFLFNFSINVLFNKITEKIVSFL